MKLYELAYTWYEEYHPHLFIGPDRTEEGWKRMCNRLLNQAAQRAVAFARTANNFDTVGWGEIVTAMIPLLEEKGYQRVEPVKHGFFGPGIITDQWGLKDASDKRLNPEVLKQIIDWNNKQLDDTGNP